MEMNVLSQRPVIAADAVRNVLYLADASSVHTVRWVNAIATLGFGVHLISLRKQSPLLDSRVIVHRPPDFGRVGYFINRNWVRKLINQIQPAVVHAHYGSGYGTLAALAGYHPTILSVWGSDVYEFPRRSPVHGWLIRFNLLMADRVLSTSHAMARQVQRFTRKKITVTPFGVDTSVFCPLEAPPECKDYVVMGTTKGLDLKYGIDYLLRGFRLLLDRVPTIPLKLLIVGSGPSEAKLRRLATELEITRETCFTGLVSHTEVLKYLRMMDVYLAPSVCDESFGVAVVEASATGIPVVASNVGGLPEVVEHEVTGLLVEPRNEIQIADALERLILNPTLRKRMGSAGRDRVKQNYEWKSSVQQMVAIYVDVVGSSEACNRDPSKCLVL